MLNAVEHRSFRFRRRRRFSSTFAYSYSSSNFFLFLYYLLVATWMVVEPACACMPGYEAERAKLRQYLGIEWTPNGLSRMNAQKVKPVRHPMELNCDFQRPDTCRWHNVQNGMDTLDFHLFRKEDSTEFPVLQIRPGPSKMAVGEQLLFVGDRRREEQSAVLASWPIRCQNSTGHLTFTFWTYNGASVEVLLLEEDPKTHELRVLPEKTHVNCGTVTVNTECSVEIPPSDKLFRIGIRAFDIRNADGAFAMIDNIFYDAQFCRVSIDFGSEFRTEPLMTADPGELIQASSQLACHNFDGRCRWRNGGHKDKTVWQRGLTAPPTDVLFNETGTYTAPTPPYAFIYIEEEMSDEASTPRKFSPSAAEKDDLRRVLVSDPILCQSPTNPAIISFRAWATKGIRMSICALDLNMNDIECQQISFTRSPAPVYHQFSVTEKFLYAFRVDHANPDFDNFVMLDDIEYRATMCVEAMNALDLGADFYTTPMLSMLLHRHIHSANDLACDFSKRALECRWANIVVGDEASTDVDDDEFGNYASDGRGGGRKSSSSTLSDTKWEVGLGRIDEVKFASLTNRHSVPESDLAIARLSWRNATALLVSDTVRCLVADGGAAATASLSFRYWRTGGASLSVCVLNAFTLRVIDCQWVVGGSDGEAETDRVVVDVPRLREPIRLALRADASAAPGVVAVDDLLFEGRICGSAAHSANSRFNLVPSQPTSTIDVGLPPHSSMRLFRKDFEPQRSYYATPTLPASNRASSNGKSLLRGSKTMFVTHSVIVEPDDENNLVFESGGFAMGSSRHGPVGRKNTEFDDDGNSLLIPTVSSETSSGDHSAPDENVCRLLSCRFASMAAQHMCLYTSTRIASSVAMFNNYNHSAQVMLFERRGRVAVLESTRFSLDTPARLHFDFVIKKGIAHLHVCQDSVERELDSCYTVDSTRTAIGRSGLPVHDYVELLPTDTKVYMIAKLDQRSRKANVQITNLELTDVENHRIC